MWDRCVAGDRLRTVMSSIMRRRRGLKSAISILLPEGVGSNTHILSGRRRSTPPRHARRGSGFVQSRSKGPLSGKSSYSKMPFPDSKSTAWEFFTDDYLQATIKRIAPPAAAYLFPISLCVQETKSAVHQHTRWTALHINRG